MTTSYTLDRSGRILSVSDNWDTLTLKADTGGLTADQVVGRRLWDFVSGVETQGYLKAIFLACRMDNLQFSMVCRCDTLTKAQDFHFSVDPQPDETLKISATEPKEVGRIGTVVDIRRWVEKKRCSICCSFQLGENWIDPMTRPDTRFFAKGFGVCPRCQAMVAGRSQEGHTGHGSNVLPFRKVRGNDR